MKDLKISRIKLLIIKAIDNLLEESPNFLEYFKNNQENNKELKSPYECAFSFRLGHYLQNLICHDEDNRGERYFVDAEYDSVNHGDYNGKGSGKTMHCSTNGTTENGMRPDLIVHTRDKEGENNVAWIEVKKTSQNDSRDFEKLEYVTKKERLKDNRNIYYFLGAYICVEKKTIVFFENGSKEEYKNTGNEWEKTSKYN